MQVTVYQNQVERALKGLKRQLNKEGLFKELKHRRFYEKPSVKKKRKINDFLKEFYIKPGINPELHDMARNQIKAHLNKLESENKVEHLGKDSYSLL